MMGLGKFISHELMGQEAVVLTTDVVGMINFSGILKLIE